MQESTPPTPERFTETDHPFASRGGLKLDQALSLSGIDPTDLKCADLGSSTGGFTSCLLHRGAAKVYAVDTGYGILDYKLRTDPRVVVMERSNALHVALPDAAAQAVDLVTIDLGWTRQDKALAAALRWLSPGGRIITLVKPHYEQPRATPERKGKGKTKPAPLEPEQARAISDKVLSAIDRDPTLELEVLGHCDSPIRGSKGGNLEVLAWLRRRPG